MTATIPERGLCRGPSIGNIMGLIKVDTGNSDYGYEHSCSAPMRFRI